jgi:antiviral helicase SLH1
MAYAAQNGGRIIRALLEIAICRKWANVSSTLMGMSKAIEKRLWPFEHPLKQTDLKPQILHNIEQWADEWEVSDLASLPPGELGQLVHLNERQGTAISNVAKEFPSVLVEYELKPVSSEILKISLSANRRFKWNPKAHGNGELFWIWIEDQDGLDILQLAQSTFRQEIERIHLDFFISISGGPQLPSITVRVISDRWLGAEDEIRIPLESVKLPINTGQFAPVLDLPFLPVSIIHNDLLENIFLTRLRFFNGMQTQILWSMLNTRQNCLVCAPTGSGKTTMAQMLCCLDSLRMQNSVVLVVTPGPDISAEWMSDLRPICSTLSIPVHVVPEKTGNVFAPARGRTIRIVGCSQLLKSISTKRPQDLKTMFSTVICDNLDRTDAAYELAISLLRCATQLWATRFVGLSGSLNDPTDLGQWLDVHPSAVYSFRPRDREQSLRIHTQTFTIPHSASLFKAMAKPAHAACSTSSCSIIFVPSRGLCRPISLDLITQCSLEDVTSRGFLPDGISEELLEHSLASLVDKSLVDILSRGVGFFHAGMHKEDRKLTMQLYAQGTIRILVVPREACWTLPARASVVVVMGTQYIHVDQGGLGRQIRDYQLTELVRMQSRAVHHGEQGHFYLFCQAENKETILRFLLDGLPLESHLLEDDTLYQWYLFSRRQKSINSKQQAVDALDFTFLAHRVTSNPLYYSNESSSKNIFLSRLVDNLERRWDLESGES